MDPTASSVLDNDVDEDETVILPQDVTHIVQRPCSLDGSFEQVDIVPSKLPPLQIKLNSDVLVTSRTEPLTAAQFEDMLDPDGRLVNEHQLRKAVFLGGVCPEIRHKVWSFLFGMYPCNSTTREREAILLDNAVKYHEMKTRWKTMLIVNSPPNSTPKQQGIVGSYLEQDDCPQGSPEDTQLAEDKSNSHIGNRSGTHPIGHNRVDFAALGHPALAQQYSEPSMNQRIEFMQIQAQVQVNREKIKVDRLKSSMRTIDKDVPRTDRDFQFYSGKGNPQLNILRDILVTFAAYDDVLGYAQGMNDILSRFLYVMGSEVETYWCFKTYMESIRNDFLETGMTNKIDLVRMLLEEMDPALLRHLEANDMGNLFFCHRWLLLGFKREFSFEDSLRCFEILSSHHLELSSLEAETAVMKEERKEFANTEGDSRSAGLTTQKEYTFEVFMCATVLIECRDDLFKCTDCGQVFSYINSIKFDLDPLLTKSERMFFIYCKKTVGESFHLVNPGKSERSKSGFFSFLLS